MRKQDSYTKTPSRSNSHNISRSQHPPYTVSQALRRLGNDPGSDIVKGPLVGGFPYNNASPRIGTTATARATDPRAGNTSTIPATGDQDRQHSQDRLGLQRQRTTGGLFVEEAESSPPQQPPPPDFSPHSLAGLYSRALFSNSQENHPYSDKEYSKEGSRGKKRRKCDLFPATRMSDKADMGVGVGVEQRSGPTMGQKAKRHCVQWWWVYLLILICIVVLVVCLVLFVGVPRIAQSRINSAELTIQGISLSQTQADNFTMSINSTIRSDSSIGAVIDPFDGVMYLEDWPPRTPFARVSFPRTTSASVTAVNVTQFTEVLDRRAFEVFNTWFLVNKTLNVSVEGDTHVRVSGISRKYPVKFKKTINMPGLNNLNGTTVPESRISLTADAQGDNFFGTVTIPNQSFIAIEIGNASFTNYMANEQNVGTVYIDNMSLLPGINNLTMRANISQSPVLTAVQQEPYCGSGVLPFELQGLDVTNHGQYLSYYTLALASTNQTVTIDVGADLAALGLDIKCPTTASTKRSRVLW